MFLASLCAEVAAPSGPAHASLQVQLFIQVDAARQTLDEVGHLACLQFVDLNASTAAFMRHFAADVKRAEELERRLRFLDAQLARKGFRLSPVMQNELQEVRCRSSLVSILFRVQFGFANVFATTGFRLALFRFVSFR